MNRKRYVIDCAEEIGLGLIIGSLAILGGMGIGLW